MLEANVEVKVLAENAFLGSSGIDEDSVAGFFVEDTDCELSLDGAVGVVDLGGLGVLLEEGVADGPPVLSGVGIETL